MERRFTLDRIRDVARQCWLALGNRTIMALHGPMGAGKTTLVHALCEEKGVSDVVGSPTFSIINEYQYPTALGRGVIYHIDLYRLSGAEEAIRAGVEDCLYSGAICLVEWPERAPELFSENTLHLYLEPIGEGERKMIIGEK